MTYFFREQFIGEQLHLRVQQKAPQHLYLYVYKKPMTAFNMSFLSLLVFMTFYPCR